MPTGTLRKNAHRHPKFSIKSAPIVGPAAPATAPIAPQIATAIGIFSRGNVCSTNASDAGTSAAAPTAWAMRPRIRNPTVGASPHSTDAPVKITTAVRKVLRRPTRSASRPAGMSSAANTIVYALSTHDIVVVLTSEKLALIDGNATNKIEVSRNTATTARLVEVRTVHSLTGRATRVLMRT